MKLRYCLERSYEAICVVFIGIAIAGCTNTSDAQRPSATQPGAYIDFEIKLVGVQLMPNPGKHSAYECDSTGRLRIFVLGEERTLRLGQEQLLSIARAADTYIRRPAPFVKRGRVIDGGATVMYVRSGHTVRVSEIQNWRMPPESEQLVDTIRRAAKGLCDTGSEVQKVELATEFLLQTDKPEERDFDEDPPVDIMANDEPSKLAELLRNNRPRWMDKGEADFLLDVLSKGALAF